MKTMSRFGKGVIVLIVASLLVPLAAWIFGVDSPNYSKEPLAPFPEWKADRAFGEKFDAWWSDHFPFRSALVTSYHKILGALTGVSGSDQVVKGRNGWYYFTPTIKDYVRDDIVTREDCEKIARSLEIQRRFTEANGGTFLVCFAPNKATIYPEHMPGWVRVVGDKRPIERLKEVMPDACYLEDALLDAKKGSAYPLYHSEDTHWNMLGSYTAYLEVMSRLGLRDRALSLSDPVMEENGWEGDLTNMLYPAIRSDSDRIVYPGFSPVYRLKRPMRTPEDPVIETVNPEKEGVLLMFRDSFANAWIDLFSDTFHTVHYSHIVPWRYDLVKDLGADVVIFEIVERNLTTLLRRTPELLAPEAFDRGDAIRRNEPFSARVTGEVRNGKHFYNFLPDDAALAEKITAVELFDGDTWYEAFPVYDHANDAESSPASGGAATRDGFSLYTAEEHDWTNVRFRTGSDWYEAPLTLS